MKKLDAVIEHLTESHLETEGGYPYDYEWVGETLVVAALDHKGGTSIETHQRSDLLAWHTRAIRFAKKTGYPLDDALFETAPVPL